MIKNYEYLTQSPTSIDRIHESCYRSFQVLQFVKEMLDRKDSHETIRDMIDILYLFKPYEAEQTKQTA